MVLAFTLAAFVLPFGFAAACGEYAAAFRRFREKRRFKAANKAALAQRKPPLSRHAVLNPAELKAKRDY